MSKKIQHCNKKLATDQLFVFQNYPGYGDSSTVWSAICPICHKMAYAFVTRYMDRPNLKLDEHQQISFITQADSEQREQFDMLVRTGSDKKGRKVLEKEKGVKDLLHTRAKVHCSQYTEMTKRPADIMGAYFARLERMRALPLKPGLA